MVPRAERRAWLLLPLGVVVTVVWAVAVVLRNPGWNGWAGWAAAVLGALAVIALVVARRRTDFGKAALSLAVAAVLLVPAVWSAGTAFAGQRAMQGGNPMAGPRLGMGAPGASFVPSDRRPGCGQLPGGPGASELSDEQRRLLDFVTGNAGDAAVPLAVEGGANSAATYLINSEATVVGMGGFMGTDDAPSVELLTRW